MIVREESLARSPGALVEGVAVSRVWNVLSEGLAYDSWAFWFGFWLLASGFSGTFVVLGPNTNIKVWVKHELFASINCFIGALVKVCDSPRALVEGIAAGWVHEIFSMISTLNLARFGNFFG